MNHLEELQDHVQSLHRFATGLAGNPTDAEDMVQECLRRILDRMNRGAEINNLRAYLFQTLRNVHVDICRKRNGRGEESLAESEMIDTVSVPPNQEDRLRCGDISQALGRIPTDQREIVLLVCLEGLSYEEISEILEIPVGTVRSRLHRGRAALHEMIEPAAVTNGYGKPGQRKMAVGEPDNE